ncbi:MAG: alpha/beta fold hydrolase [Paracoccaceae bacterium]
MIHTAPDGCRIHYDTAGTAGPRVLLIPGLGGDSRFWTGVAGDLGRDHRLILADHRGAGRSDRPDSAYSIPQIAADMAAILRETGGRAHVVGHSTGGAIAQVLTLDHADLVASVTISASWARADARFAAMFRARAAMIEAGLAEAYQELTPVLGHEPDYLADRAGDLARAVAAAPRTLAPFTVTARRVRMLLDHDRLTDLPRIAVPALILAASQDEMTPPPMQQQIANAIPGARLVRLPGAHFHPVAHPDRLSAAVRDFLAGLAP